MADSRHLHLRSVNHISKVCSNLEASVAFYRDVLGFIVVKRPDSFNASFDGCWLWRYGLGLHLIKGQPVPRSSVIDPKSDHLSFQADSLDEVQAQLHAHGMPFVRQQVFEGGLEVQQLFFHDPDNNMIEVCNCDCLPIIPLDLARCQTCNEEASRLTSAQRVAGMELPPLACSGRHHSCNNGIGIKCVHEEDEAEAMSDGGVSRDSLDSGRSEQINNGSGEWTVLMAGNGISE